MKRLLFISIASILFILSFNNNVRGEEITSPVGVYFMQDVKSAIRQAQARYESGNVTGAADLARKILAKYPDNSDAKAILDKCIATERKDYENAVSSLTVSELTGFQKKYPESDYGEDIANRIADLPLWLAAKGTNTIEAYNKYLSESSHKLYKEDADNAIADITVKQAFDAAIAANTIKAFEQFRSQYPNSKYDKDASNKIARLMADKFTSKSTYTDKSNALAYAMNEMTRDYVNNKYNKATEKRSSSSSSSSYSGSSSSSASSSGRSTSTGSNSGNYGRSIISSKTSIRFGFNVLADMGTYYNYSGDLWYDAFPYTFGLGGLVRFGDQRYRLNFITGLKVLFSNANTKYTVWESYSSHKETDRTQVTSFVIPLELNWNMLSTDNFGMYLGIGYQAGFQKSQAMKISFGMSWLHGDWSFYYLKYFKGPVYEKSDLSPFMGTSYTYYF